jgi:ABC-type phosphate transport system substrate-binding protein
MARPTSFLLFFTLLLTASFATASSFIVITRSTSEQSSITKNELREIYSGDQVFWSGGKRIRAARLPDDEQTTVDFLQSVLGKSPTQFVQFWRHKLFSGKGLPPKIVDDTEKMISYVSDTEGSIGYVPGKKKPENPKIKILEVVD